MARRTQSDRVTVAQTPASAFLRLRTPESRGKKRPRQSSGKLKLACRTVSHYKIVEQIGNGGMSVVYKALDLKLDRLVALKFLPPHLEAAGDPVVRFLQEARAISALNHPHIATIYELDQSPSGMFLALEYLPGGTLGALIRDLSSRGEWLPLRQLVAYAAGIADGLRHAHRNGIIHRDVKSDNVMLTAEGTVKITDFGLAKLRGGSHLTRDGSIVGTVAYMSPEQARCAQVDHRSDIFSFGVVLYEMATGRLPFRGPHEAAILSRILGSRPQGVRELRPGLPSAFERIVVRALEKNREQRYQDLDELLDDLQTMAGRLPSESEKTPSEADTQVLTPPPTSKIQKLWSRLAGVRLWLKLAVLSGVALAAAARHFLP